MRLTDIVNAEDVLKFFRHNLERGISPLGLADKLTDKRQHTPELKQMVLMFYELGFNIPETATLLQFLDAAIQHKTVTQ